MPRKTTPTTRRARQPRDFERFPDAEKELSDENILERYGDLLAEARRCFTGGLDVSWLVEFAEAGNRIAANEERKAATAEEREARTKAVKRAARERDKAKKAAATDPQRKNS